MAAESERKVGQLGPAGTPAEEVSDTAIPSREAAAGGADDWTPAECAALAQAAIDYPEQMGKKKRFARIKKAVNAAGGGSRSSHECYDRWKRHVRRGSSVES